ncbi:MAG: ABC transporter ATP-binding protein [Sedimentisphaerales bacterium]|nr:ABC transporter ATP-binding protein [Sedimentisphaerales bacterium]MBN2841748.1 ABC transporter ATP-binding protein [Sedimentisphaerales bacterium]
MTEKIDNPIIELRSVSKTFDHRNYILKDFSLAFERGKSTVIIGPSGCGKTVTLKIIMSLMKPDEGEVHFSGQRIDQMSESQLIEIRKRCGFLFQSGALFDSQTVAYNVAFPLFQHTKKKDKEIFEIVREKLELVGLSDMFDRYPSQLSGGQQKRIALARAIALEPEVIFYDEPTTGLDPLRTDDISRLIARMQEQLKITSIVVTHDMKSAATIADRVVMMDKGKVVADGSCDEICHSSNPVVRRFVTGDSTSE